MEWALSWFCSCIYLIGSKLIRKLRRDLPQIMLPELVKSTKKKLLFKLTYFFLLNCQESEAHVIPQMTTLKKLQLSLRHAHGSHAARAIP